MNVPPPEAGVAQSGCRTLQGVGGVELTKHPDGHWIATGFVFRG